MQISCTDRELFIFKKIGAAAAQAGYPAYVVGGFVRDKLLRRPTKDIDVVCLGDAIHLANEVAGRFGSHKPPVSFFKNFGTAQLKLPDYEVEFVGARKESYRDSSRKPDVERGTMEDDQQRRDFTINALSVSLNADDYGELIDPFNGLRDLSLKIIKTPLEPGITFSDDPLRMMRAIRFATQLNFSIDENTFQAIMQHKERIKIVSQERITDELNKIMLSKKPSIGWDLLFKSGLLEIIFPAFAAMAGVERKNNIGHKDNFYHTLQVLDNISRETKDLWLRWAALLHDIGKPAVKTFDENAGWTFHGHEIVGAKMVTKIFSKLKLPLNEKMKYVQKLVSLHMRPITLTKENITDSAVRRLLFEAGEDVDDLMTLCRADITSKNRQKVEQYLQNFEFVAKRMQEVEAADQLRNWQPPVSGELIMTTFGIGSCRNVGIIKDAVREAILDGEISNDYEAAYQLMLKKGEALGLRAVNNQNQN